MGDTLIFQYGRVCLRCGLWKPEADFGRYTRRPDMLLPRCRECGRECVRAYQARRREAGREAEGTPEGCGRE